MPRLDYRKIGPKPEAEKVFGNWIQKLDEEFANPDPQHRSDVVRDALQGLYADGHSQGSLAHQAMVHSLDPRNATLEPEYYGDVDRATYAERKQRIWFWL